MKLVQSRIQSGEITLLEVYLFGRRRSIHTACLLPTGLTTARMLLQIRRVLMYVYVHIYIYLLHNFLF
jgi:hypothetical protein